MTFWVSLSCTYFWGSNKGHLNHSCASWIVLQLPFGNPQGQGAIALQRSPEASKENDVSSVLPQEHSFMHSHIGIINYYKQSSLMLWKWGPRERWGRMICKSMWGWSEIQVSSEQKAFWGGGISTTAEVSTASLHVTPLRVSHSKTGGRNLRLARMCLVVSDKTALFLCRSAHLCKNQNLTACL